MRKGPYSDNSGPRKMGSRMSGCVIHAPSAACYGAYGDGA